MTKNTMKTESQNNPIFSYFREPVTNVIPEESINLEHCCRVISGKDLEQVTFELRQLETKAEKRDFKAARFPFVTFSGMFSHRSENGLQQHSGLMVLDFDNLESMRIKLMKIRLLLDKYLRCVLLFTSPSGTGLKAVLEIDVSGRYSHGQIFDAIRNYLKKTYELDADPSGRDVCRICFLCHDPEAVLHHGYGSIGFPLPEKVFQINKKNFSVKKWLQPEKPVRKPSKLLLNTNGSSNDVEEIISRIEAVKIDLTTDHKDWVKLGFSFASEFGESGRSYFHRISYFHPEYDEQKCDKQYDECMKGLRFGSIRIFFASARDAGINIKV